MEPKRRKLVKGQRREHAESPCQYEQPGKSLSAFVPAMGIKTPEAPKHSRTRGSRQSQQYDQFHTEKTELLVLAGRLGGGDIAFFKALHGLYPSQELLRFFLVGVGANSYPHDIGTAQGSRRHGALQAFVL